MVTQKLRNELQKIVGKCQSLFLYEMFAHSCLSEKLSQPHSRVFNFFSEFSMTDNKLETADLSGLAQLGDRLDKDLAQYGQFLLLWRG